ncbi:WD repeat-containing protein 46 [Hemiscyllium ocellatum]|uniref:WD repeat-containing protein 46 n=1 Tax=Hemiscyllium ocellatum TaxID=170820 RepID=UPI00296755E4|nr:WD repeat-containing protein 46 [Hemiscyllium ocellatum]
MAAPSSSSSTLQNRKRYWESGTEASGDAAPAPAKGSEAAERVKVAQRKLRSRRSRRGKQMGCPAKKVLSGRQDPFPGPAPIPKEVMRKFNRGVSVKVGRITNHKVKSDLKVLGDLSKAAAKQAARFELLLPEDAGCIVEILTGHKVKVMLVSEKQRWELFQEQEEEEEEEEDTEVPAPGHSC